MKRFLFLLACLIVCGSTLQAQTTLTDGDIAFTRINGDDPDSFSFVFLADAESGTTILFSTEYWDAVVDTFSNYYFTLQFTATSNISAGEEAHINADLMQLEFTSGSSLASLSSLGPVNPFAGNLIHSGGDNILAFQGSKASPTFIAGISSETGNSGTSGNSWQTNFSVNDTQLPAGKTNAQDGYLGLYPFGTSSLNEYDNARYMPGALHTGDKATLLAEIMDLSNWEFHGSDTFGIVGLPAFSVSSSCSMTASITSQTNVACTGASTGSLTVTQSSGAANFDYAWSNGASTSNSASSTNTITGLSATTYTVTVTDNNGCTATASSTITQPGSALSASASVSSALDCNGDTDGQVTANPSGGTSPYTYSWNTGETSQTETGLGAGTYSVTITDQNGCTDSASITLTQPTALVASAAVTGTLDCNGDTDGVVTASPSGGTSPYTYSWNTGGTSASETGLGAGTYSVTITDQNGCTDSASTTLSEPSALVASASVSSALDCNGDTDGVVTASPSGGTSPYTYSWNTGGTSASETGLGAGTYSVTITDQNGCTDSASTTLSEPSALVASASVSSALDCNGDTDGQVTANPSGGTSPYTYSWNTGETNQTETGLGAGTYSVTITDQNGCTDSASITLTQPTALVASAAVTGTLDCNGDTDGIVTASPSGGTSPYTYSWNTGGTSASETGLGAGTYSVTITDQNGCTDSASTTLSEPSSLVASAAVTGTLDCNGDTDGVVTASPSGGTSPYTYSWNTGGTSASETGLGAGTYSVTITDQNGCTDSASTTLSEPSSLVASAAVTGTLDCNGDTDGVVTASPSGGTSPYTYSWNTGGTSASETGLGAGTYSVTITDQNGCTDSASTTLSEPSALVASAAVTGTLDCNGDTDGVVTASPSGGTSPYTYSWNTGGTSASETGLGAGTYSVTITDQNGCTDSASTTLSEPSALVASAAVTGTLDCNGDTDGVVTASPSGGTSPYTYSWNTGGTSASETGLGAGTYSVTITDQNGCTDSASTTLSEPSALVASAAVTGTLDCNGDTDGVVTASPSGGTSPYTYSWNTGGTSASETGLGADTYSVTITDQNGCTDSASTTLSEPASLSAAIFVDSNVSCNGGSDGGATASPTGGTGPFTYSWSNSATTASITGVAASAYFVTITDANGCTATALGFVNEPPALSAGVSVDSNASCNGGSDGGLTASATGGTAGYTYTWSNTATTASITGVMAGTYSVTITDANGCTDSASGTVTEPTALVAAAVVDSNATCNGGSDGGATSSATGGTGAYTYSWSNTATTASITGVMAGTYSVTVTDANGCTDSASITVTEPASLVAATVTDSNASCNGFSDGGLTASATGGTMAYSYNWNNGATTASITGVMAGTYSVTVTDANGCTDSASGTVTEPASLVASAVADSNVSCNGFSDGGATSSTTGGTGAYTYSWNNGATTASITGVLAGTYSVTVTDANGCTDSASVTITEPASLVAATVADSNVSCNGFSDAGLTASATGGTMAYSYNWNNGATTASITGVMAGTYSVTITDANGCTDSASGTVTEPASLVAATVVDSNASCNGFSDAGLTASATGGTMAYTYTWSNTATTASITGVMAGTYSVTVTDANGCTDSASGTATEPTVLSVLVSVDNNATCNGGSDGSLTATPSGGTAGYDYNWSSSGTFATETGLAAGTYTVTVTDANGCTANNSGTVTQPSALDGGTINVGP